MNGDITSHGDADEALAQSGADGVMIGRGCYGKPWFIGQVIEWLRHRRRRPDPPLAAQYRIVRGHYDDMLSHYGSEVGLRIARKHLGWYSKGLPGSAEFRRGQPDRRGAARQGTAARLLRSADRVRSA